MSQAQITPASLTAFLVVYSSIPMIVEKLATRTPVLGVRLTQLQRSELGLTKSGETVVYDVGATPVVMDMAGETCTISFAGADAGTAMSLLEEGLRHEHPTLIQTEDVVHPNGGPKRLRVYAGDLSPERRCQVEVDYPTPNPPPAGNRFVVRVSGYAYKRQ